MRRSFLIGALFVVLGLAGCGGGGSGAGATPEATFEAMKSAAAKKDWTGMFACMTPDSQDQSIGGLAMMVQFMGMMPGGGDKMKAGTEILKKHGVQLDAAPKMPSFAAGGKGPAPMVDPREAMKKMTSGVKDKAACLGEFMTWFEKNVDESQRKGMDPEEIAKSKLTDVKIDGDKATGKVTTKKNGKDESKDVSFRKIDGKWYADSDDKMKK